jgi:hypothetical protein
MKERSVPIRPGIEEHLVRGAMSLCEFGIYALIHIQADYRTGIWRGSAPRIVATAPRGASLRQIQRALEHFEELGYLKCFRVQGARGNTPYLIDKFNGPSGAWLIFARTSTDSWMVRSWPPEERRQMENQLLPVSPCKTQEGSVSTDALIREWLFRFGVEHKEDVAPKLPLWLETFGPMDAAILERLFSRALKTCRFFPKVSEILEPLTTAEAKATPEAAEEAWARVLEIRRIHWNPDILGPFNRAVAGLSERVRQAARAAGVFRDD